MPNVSRTSSRSSTPRSRAWRRTLAATIVVFAPLFLSPVASASAAAASPPAAQETPPARQAEPVSPAGTAAKAGKSDDVSGDGAPDAQPAAEPTLEQTLQGTLREIPAFAELTVTVRNRVARVAGSVPSREDADKALELIRSFDGVLYVVDETSIPRQVIERLAPNVQRFYAWGRETIATLPLIVLAILVLAIGWWIGRWFVRSSVVFGRMSNRLLRDLLKQGGRLVILLLAGYIALELLDATALVGALLGTAGVVGLALSFAFRDIVENFLASIFLSVRRPFHLRDVVEVAGHTGTIVRMTTSHTELVTPDGNNLRIPNASVFKGDVLNYSRNPRRRFGVSVGVGVNEDLKRAQRLGIELLEAMNGVMDDPGPSARVESLGDSSVNLLFYAWVDQRHADFVKVRSEATRLIKTRFDEEEIEMPEPTYRVLIDRRAATVERDDERRRRPSSGEAIGDASGPLDIAPESDVDDQVEEEIRSDAQGGDLLNA